MTLEPSVINKIIATCETISDDAMIAEAFKTTKAKVAALRELAANREKRSQSARLGNIEVVKDEHPASDVDHCDRQHYIEMRDGSERLLAAIIQTLQAR